MTLPAPPPLPSKEAQLIRAYTKAQSDIIDMVIRFSQRGSIGTAALRRGLLAETNRILAALQNQSNEWVEKNIPIEYRNALREADAVILQQYIDAGVDPPTFPSFTVIDQEAVNIATDGVRNQFEQMIIDTERRMAAQYNQIITDAVSNKAITGTATRQAQAGLIQAMTQEGVTAIEYMRMGKPVRMSLSAYSETVIRSATAEVTNEASIRRTQQISGDLVKMTAHRTSCPICWPLQGRVYSISGSTPGYPRLDVAFSGDHVNIHPNCVLPGTIVSGPPILAHMTRSYEGEIIVIHGAGGEELSVTPRHPVLTRKGWVDAGSLNEGDKIVKYTGEKRASCSVDPDKVHIPTAIEDIPSSIWEPGDLQTVTNPVVSVDFHGDGADSKICIIRSNRFLLSKGDTIFSKHVGKRYFEFGNKNLPFFSGFGPFTSFLKRNLTTPGRYIGGLRKRLALVFGHSAKPGGHSVASVFGWDTGLGKPFANSHFANAELTSNSALGHTVFVKMDNLANRKTFLVFVNLARNSWAKIGKHYTGFMGMFFKGAYANIQNGRYLADSLTGNVELLDIIKINRRYFSGHVYNLHTTENWFIANGIITRNCRHRINPYIPALKTPTELTKDRAFSSRPLEIENMSEGAQAIFRKNLEAYNKSQAIKSTALANRNQWQRYRSRLGDDAPARLSTFMRMKNKGGERWDKLQSGYRAAGREIKEELL